MVPSDKPSVSIVVLAYNEERNLPLTIASIRKALDGMKLSYEIVIVNDGSRDRTLEVANEMANQYSVVRAVSNPGNRGCGYTYWHGANESKTDFVWLIPGDNEITIEAMQAIAGKIGTTDLIIPYVMNFNIRPFSRRFISWGYTSILNILFFKNIRYYNGPFVVRRSLLKTVRQVPTRDFTFQAPIIMPLVARGHSYTQVGILLQQRRFGQPTFGSFKAIGRATKTISRLWWDINMGGGQCS